MLASVPLPAEGQSTQGAGVRLVTSLSGWQSYISDSLSISLLLNRNIMYSFSGILGSISATCPRDGVFLKVLVFLACSLRILVALALPAQTGRAETTWTARLGHLQLCTYIEAHAGDENASWRQSRSVQVVHSAPYCLRPNLSSATSRGWKHTPPLPCPVSQAVG